MFIYQKDIEKIVERERDNKIAMEYYEGGVPEYFSTPQMRKAVRSTVRNIGLNYSRVPVQEMLNRLEVTAVLGTSEKANRVLKTVDETNQLDTFFDDLFMKASVYGEAFAMAWPDAEGKWRLSSHSPLEVYVAYDADEPWIVDHAIKVWQATDQELRMNVFTKDTIKKYKASSIGLSAAVNWELIDTLENPFEEVPVFHLKNGGEHGRPEHVDAYAPQDAINKLVITHMYTIDYQGAPQRYALSTMDASGEHEDFDEEGTDRKNIAAMSSDPGELWYLKGVNQVGEFTSADPGIFWEPIQSNIQAMASITGTPLHYFDNSGNVPSGQALRAAEAPLLTKVKKRRHAYGLPLKRLFEFILKAENVAKSAVEIKWADLESMDVMDEWDLYLKKRNAGLPIRQILLEAGYTDVEVNQIFEWKLEEAEQLQQVTDYQRKPQVRVQTENDENNVDSESDAG